MTTFDAKNVNHPEHREPLNEEKYRVVREAILASLPAGGESMTFRDLETAVAAFLLEKKVPTSMFPKPGSVRWYTKAVQLDLEARGVIERVPKRVPMELRRT